MNVSASIRKARRAKGWKAADLARALDRPRSTIHAWENGGPGPKMKDLPTIARVLDTTVAALVSGKRAA